MTSVIKLRFCSLNNKICFFPNKIVSLPFGHPFLENTRNIKKQFKRKIQNHIEQIKDKLLKEEYCVLGKCERWRIFEHFVYYILGQLLTYYKLDSKKRHNTDVDFKPCTTREYILNSCWF